MKPFIPDIVCFAIALVLLLCERWADKKGLGKIVGGIWKVLVLLAIIHIAYRLFVK